MKNAKKSTKFSSLKTHEPFAFPAEPGRRLIKRGKRTFARDGAPDDVFTVDRMTRTVTRKPWKNTNSRNPSGRRRQTTFYGPFSINTWFERDRAHVELLDVNDETVIEWWDEEVQDAIEDGFLDPKDFLESAMAYAEEMGFELVEDEER